MKQIIRRNLKILFILIYSTTIGLGQFETLVEKAWAQNNGLQSKTFSLEQSSLAIKEAKAMYGPTAATNIQYTLATGGRNIEFPIGDLLNPAYSTLNALTNSNKFPTLENITTNFLPNNFYDAKLSIQQPIYYPDLAINKEVKQYQYNIKEQEIKAMKRLISKEVINTTIQIVMGEYAMNIYQENRKLLDEATRTTISMLRNGIALPSSLNRIEAQIAMLQEQEIITLNNIKNAKRYMFFLTKDSVSQSIKNYLQGFPSIQKNSIGNREELAQLEETSKIYSTLIKKENLFYRPRIGAQLDLGSQAFNFGLSPYALLGLNFNLNVFDNKRHKLRKGIANVALSEHNKNSDYVQDQISLQTDISYNNFQSALDQLNSFPNRVTSASKVYKDVFIKYKEGTANYLELIDAQTQLSNTQIQANLAKYNAWLRWSEYYYNTAQFKIQ